MTVPAIVIDKEIKSAARENANFYAKEARKRGIKGTKFSSDKDTFYIGFLGEMAARRYFDLPLTVKKYIDFGCDFEYQGNKIDVKTSSLNKPLREPLKDGFKVFVGTNDKLEGSDTLLFAKLSPDYRVVHFLGWLPKKELPKFPVVKTGKMPVPARCIFYKYLRPISTLII